MTFIQNDVTESIVNSHYRVELEKAFLINKEIFVIIQNLWKQNTYAMDVLPKCITATSKEHQDISIHLPFDWLFSSLFKHSSKKISNRCVTGLCEGNPSVTGVTGLCEWNPSVTGGSPHKGPVTPKMFPFHDVIMNLLCFSSNCFQHGGLRDAWGGLYQWLRHARGIPEDGQVWRQHEGPGMEEPCTTALGLSERWGWGSWQTSPLK